MSKQRKQTAVTPYRKKSIRPKLIMAAIVIGIIALIAGASYLTMGGSTEVRVPAQGVVDSARTYTFAADIQPIFAAKCVICHNPQGMMAVMPLETYQQVMQKVKSGNPAASPLIHALNGNMKKYMNEEEYGKTYVWTRQGAQP